MQMRLVARRDLQRRRLDLGKALGVEMGAQRAQRPRPAPASEGGGRVSVWAPKRRSGAEGIDNWLPIWSFGGESVWCAPH